MGGSPRTVFEGGISRVYNLVSRGEHAFRVGAEVEGLQRRLPETKRRDGFQVLAWCLTSNNDELALRMDEVARGLEKNVETASRLVSRAVARQVEDEDYRSMANGIDTAVVGSVGKARGPRSGQRATRTSTTVPGTFTFGVDCGVDDRILPPAAKETGDEAAIEAGSTSLSRVDLDGLPGVSFSALTRGHTVRG